MVTRLPVPVRRAVRAAGFATATLAMLVGYSARKAMTGDAKKDVVRDRWLRLWSSSLLRLFAIQLEVYGASPPRVSRGEAPPQPRGRLVVANHRSTIDIGILLQLFGGHMVSRADLSTWPLLGAAARSVGTVFVDREDAASGASAIREMRQLLKRGQTVDLFPEGTTFEGDLVHPFHPGAFVAVLRTDAEIIPVGLAYAKGSGAAFVNETFPQHLSRIAGSSPTRVAACIGAPLVVSVRARAQELKDAAHAAVQELVHEARGRLEGS
jgi:1-acyl-sn-glycerol-3-phosphate acyltransferase